MSPSGCPWCALHRPRPQRVLSSVISRPRQVCRRNNRSFCFLLCEIPSIRRLPGELAYRFFHFACQGQRTTFHVQGRALPVIPRGTQTSLASLTVPSPSSLGLQTESASRTLGCMKTGGSGESGATDLNMDINLWAVGKCCRLLPCSDGEKETIASIIYF